MQLLHVAAAISYSLFRSCLAQTRRNVRRCWPNIFVPRRCRTMSRKRTASHGSSWKSPATTDSACELAPAAVRSRGFSLLVCHGWQVPAPVSKMPHVLQGLGKTVSRGSA